MGSKQTIRLVTAMTMVICSRYGSAQLDQTYWSGSPDWVPLSINTSDYKALAEEATHTGPILIVHGAKADGSGCYQVISTNWGQSWSENFISSTDYKELATMHGIANQFYASRADGTGLERVVFIGNTWTTFAVIGNDYKALAADPSLAGPTLMVYGARADGTGVDRVRSDDWGATWYLDFSLLTTTDYRELETVPGVANSFYAARADGTGLERLYYSYPLDSWQTQTVVPVNYKGLATDLIQQGPIFLVFGSRADGTGVDRIRSDDWGVSWSVEVPLLATIDYDELATMNGIANQFYAARANGSGLNRVYTEGGHGWQSVNLTAASYKALAQEATQAGPILITHGARTDASGLYQIISTDWGSTWSENPITSTDYKELATMHGIANQFYASRADGTGLERVYFSGNIWNTLPVVAHNYKALAADPSQTGPTLMVYGARADGTGVDRVRSNDWGTNWYLDFALLTSTDYNELETVTGVANSFFANRADGTGLERVYYSAGWITQAVVAGNYKSLAADPGQSGPIFLVYGARSDGAGVDRIRSDNWGGTWYVDQSSLTTNDYTELCTMTGLANQFYGSYVVDNNPCNDPVFDADNDNDVDQDDFGIFQRCYTGLNDPQQVFSSLPIECTCMDIDGDQDLDQVDLIALTSCFSGAAVPADPACDN